MFQSLSGFLMSCNAVSTVSVALTLTVFQSLSGFLMSCNSEPPSTWIMEIRVSIPIGFSNEL